MTSDVNFNLGNLELQFFKITFSAYTSITVHVGIAHTILLQLEVSVAEEELDQTIDVSLATVTVTSLETVEGRCNSVS